MKTEIMIAVLALMCIGSMAAAFVLWAKVDELKKANVEERENYLAALNLANTNAETAMKMDEEVDGKILNLKALCDIQKQENAKLQDRLSSILCPSNNHVWKDGVCVKCGRVKDA